MKEIDAFLDRLAKRYGYTEAADHIRAVAEKELRAGKLPPELFEETLVLKDGTSETVAIPVHIHRPIGNVMETWRLAQNVSVDELVTTFDLRANKPRQYKNSSQFIDKELIGAAEVLHVSPGILMTRLLPEEVALQYPGADIQTIVPVDFSRTFGDTIRAWREHTGMDQAELGRRIGYRANSRSSMSGIENNHPQRKYIRDHQLAEAARALRIPLGVLVTRKMPHDFG